MYEGTCYEFCQNKQYNYFLNMPTIYKKEDWNYEQNHIFSIGFFSLLSHGQREMYSRWKNVADKMVFKYVLFYLW